ncbi:hypothetical protein CmeUKMEL1_17505 [Cryptosporidium meleagridis]|uniref:Uncharacterized protein n=1 Tax=Cryptosporidium meleagridis TaxID=93969 RepID=A0A2P4Z5W4_9CRYT|nr:hypothetical protein CmeUKMEL1_17505 [Cryptosporidium meleagridis]
MRCSEIEARFFLKGISSQKSSWRIRTILFFIIFKSIESYGKADLVTQSIVNNEANMEMRYLQKNQNTTDLNNYNLTMLIKEEDGGSNSYRNSNQKFHDTIGNMGLLGLGNKTFDNHFQLETPIISNLKYNLNYEQIFNGTDYKNKTVLYQPLNSRRMAEYELIHRDQIVFRPVGYHQFDVIPQVIHQIPQNQYPMFRSGYLGYPYNPINYYRSPYITTVKKNRTRILSEDIDNNIENGYKVEYEIMELLNENNNSIFNY